MSRILRVPSEKEEELKKKEVAECVAWVKTSRAFKEFIENFRLQDLMQTYDAMEKYDFKIAGGAFCVHLMNEQLKDPSKSDICAALAGLVGIKFFFVTDLFIKRLISTVIITYEFQSEKYCRLSTFFLAHVMRYEMVHYDDIVGITMDFLTYLCKNKTIMSLNLANQYIQTCGRKLDIVFEGGLLNGFIPKLEALKLDRQLTRGIVAYVKKYVSSNFKHTNPIPQHLADRPSPNTGYRHSFKLYAYLEHPVDSRLALSGVDPTEDGLHKLTPIITPIGLNDKSLQIIGSCMTGTDRRELLTTRMSKVLVMFDVAREQEDEERAELARANAEAEEEGDKEDDADADKKDEVKEEKDYRAQKAQFLKDMEEMHQMFLNQL